MLRTRYEVLDKDEVITNIEFVEYSIGRWYSHEYVGNDLVRADGPYETEVDGVTDYMSWGWDLRFVSADGERA